MPTAKKLPSGSYRVQVYSHKDGTGHKVYESFTAPTKKEAELKAAEWLNKRDRHSRNNMTVHEAIEGYINAKEGVLSPSTIRAYRILLRNDYKPLENTQIKKLNSEKLQIFVSDLVGKLSAKSVSNIYGLLSSALKMYMPDVVFRVTLPKKIKVRKSAPSNEDIIALFNTAPPELKKCIAIGAYGGLRRGELCALTFGDIEGNVIHITKDIVQASDKSWVVKDIPKTEDSYRDAFLPDKVLDMIGAGAPSERVIKYKNPTSVTRVFTRIRDRLKLNICFHDLRHYFASIGAVLGIPDNYLSDFGGWKRGSSVMKEVYQNNIISMSEIYSEKMKKYFDDMM